MHTFFSAIHMSLTNSQEKSNEVYYNDIIENAFDPDMTDLAELLGDNFIPNGDIDGVSEGLGEVISESSTAMTNLVELLSDSPIPADIVAARMNNSHLSSAAQSTEPEEQSLVVSKLMKTSKRVTKLQKSTVLKTAVRKHNSIRELLARSDQKPNMSRRRPTSVLVAFPAFDKCDSLLYFPTTLIRLLNSADMDAALKLMNKYMDKTCKVTMQGKNASDISFQCYKQVMTMGNDIEPDRIMCVHSTKVIENKITSSIYVKFTDVQSLYSDLARTSKVFEDEEFLKTGMYPDRARRFQFFAAEAPHNTQLAQDLMAYSQREENVLVYMRLDFTLTVDDVTRKILHFSHGYEITSVHIEGAENILK